MSTVRKKRKITSPPQPHHAHLKKLRSNLPRRRRCLFSPIVLPQGRRPNQALFSISVNSSCDDVSCNTTRDSVAAAGSRSDAFRRVTRSYSKHKEIDRPKWMDIGGGDEAEVLESSCVESCSIADSESKLHSFVHNGVLATQHESEVSCGMVAAPNSASTIEQRNAKISDAADSSLACSEGLSEEEYTSSAFSEFQSEDLFDKLDTDFLSDTSLLWTDSSGSQFSPGDSTPSPCFALFTQYSQQFTRLSSNEIQSNVVDEFVDEFVFRRFENEDDEESYQRLRGRERRNAIKIDDYVALHAFNTDYGILVHEQRLLMVNWIVEMSDMKELHDETTFLAVRLLDRFLSKGFFKSSRNLEIVGVACLTLATRIEENQPYNCVLQKLFHVKENVYGQTEVVAMEWLVQKELNFQCFSPTIYSFLWYYLKAAAGDQEMESLAKHLAELVLFDHKQLQFWPSSVAAGIIMLVSLAAKQDQSCQRVMEVHVRTSMDDLPECIKSLERLVKYTYL